MGATAGAAEAAVRAQRGGATTTPGDSVQGQFRGRRVSQDTEFQGVSPRQFQEANGSARGRGQRRTAAGRLIAAARTFVSIASPGISRSGQPPTRDVRVLEVEVRPTLRDVPPDGLDPATVRGVAHMDAREAASPAAPLPWLTPSQNAERRMQEGRLQQLRAHPAIPLESLVHLSAVVHLVDRVEQDVLRARVLLQKSQTELISDAEWRELAALIAAQHDPNSPLQAELNDRLVRLTESAIPGSKIERMSHESGQRLALAREHLSSNDLPWSAAPWSVAEALPVNGEPRLDLQCRLVPGTALGARFAEGYPGDDRDNLYLGARFNHVPGLALATVADATGRTLYSGLHHGLIDVQGLDGEFLNRLSDAELKTLVGALLFGGDQGEYEDRDVARSIDEECRSIKASPEAAELRATAMRQAACRQMARETATAALVADPEKFQRALAGERVDLTLCAISLLDPDDVHAWDNQAEAFDTLSRETPVELAVCSMDRMPHRVSANVRVRQFVLQPDPALATIDPLDTRDYESATCLLGPGFTQALGGEVGVRVHAMKVRISRLREDSLAMEQDQARCVAKLGADHPRSVVMLKTLEKMKAARSNLVRDALSLEQAGQQLKSMWAEDSRRAWPAGPDVHRVVASRLALIGHLMGETPALISSNSQRLEQEIQPEAMFVAAVAHRLDGHVTPVDLEREDWQQVRDSFVNRPPGDAPARP